MFSQQKVFSKSFPKLTNTVKLLVGVLIDLPLLSIEVLHWEGRLKLLRLKFAEETDNSPVFIHVFLAFERLGEVRDFMGVFGAKDLAQVEPPVYDMNLSSKDKRFLYQHIVYYLLQHRTTTFYQHLVLLPDFLRPYEQELRKRRFEDAIFHGARMLSRKI